MENMQVCFVNTDQVPLSVKHIAYFTAREMGSGNEDKICLMEVIESKYPHPDAPDVAVVSCVSTRLVDKQNAKKNNLVAHMVLLESAQSNTRSMVQKLSTF